MHAQQVQSLFIKELQSLQNTILRQYNDHTKTQNQAVTLKTHEREIKSLVPSRPLNLRFIRKSHTWLVLWHVTIKGNVGHYPFIFNRFAFRNDGI